jgi:hypothetical protein
MINKYLKNLWIDLILLEIYFCSLNCLADLLYLFNRFIGLLFRLLILCMMVVTMD